MPAEVFVETMLLGVFALFALGLVGILILKTLEYINETGGILLYITIALMVGGIAFGLGLIIMSAGGE